MNTFSHVPPGFRFHPTDEELVDYYLRKKVTSRRIDLDVIKEVDLYKIEPWDLQELCRLGTEEQNDWYFFSHKDKKYPTGTRTNRATAAGFWKATGRDKAIYSKHDLVGMRKTLVFYKGRAPNGQKSDWIMHEYRLETDENGTSQEEGWVVCRVFKKRIATTRRMNEHDSPYWYDDQVSFMPELDSSPSKPNSHNSNHILPYQNHNYHHLSYSCKKELDHHLQYQFPHDHFLQLPLLESPKFLHQSASASIALSCNSPMGPSYCLDMNNHHGSTSNLQSSSLTQEDPHIQQISHEQNMHHPIYENNSTNNEQEAVDQVTDWRVLDKFVASQLSQEDGNIINKERNYQNGDDNVFHVTDHHHTIQNQNQTTSASTSSCQIDLWK